MSYDQKGRGSGNRYANDEILWLAAKIREAAYNCPVRLYCACQTTSDASRFFWPFKLFPVSGKNVQPAIKPKLCDYWILDSNIFDASVTNEMIIDAEAEHHPNYVVPKDYLGDADRTESSVRDFFKNYSGWAEPIIPLQPPYVKSYEALRQFGEYFAIGSIRDANLQTDFGKTRKGIIQILKETDCPKLHLFGVSFSEKIIDLVYNERIVSCDSRSWFLAAINGMYREFSGHKVRLNGPFGKDSSLARGQRALSSLLDQAIALSNPKENNLGNIAWWKLDDG